MTIQILELTNEDTLKQIEELDTISATIIQENMTKDKKEVEYYFNDRIEGYFHGSGDIYSSSLLAGIMKDMSLSMS